MSGIKHDQGKSRIDLIAPEMLFALGDILAYGAQKYAQRNWEQGMDWGRVFGALMRHMWAWWGGEDLDPESELSHLGHAAFHVMGLMQLSYTHKDLDDRPQLP